MHYVHLRFTYCDMSERVYNKGLFSEVGVKKHSGTRWGLTEDVNKARFKWMRIHNIKRIYKITLNTTVWWYLTGSEYNLGWTSLNGQGSVFVCWWQRGRDIFSAWPKYGHFQNRTQCAWFAQLTQWVIPIYFFSLFHNFMLSSALPS